VSTVDALAARLARLANSDNLSDELDAVRRSAEGDGVDDLYPLALALAAGPAAGIQRPWQYDTLLRALVQALAVVAGRRNAELAAAVTVETFPVPPPRPPFSRVQAVASMLAAVQPTEHLVPLFADRPRQPGALELQACLAHELVLRTGGVTEPVIVDLIGRLAALAHPLGGMPPHLLDIERGLPLPRYGRHGSSASVNYGIRYGDPAMPAGAAPGSPPVDITDGASAERILAAVANWAAGSNGRIEAGVYRYDRTVDPAAVGPAMLAGLPPESLRDADPGQVAVRRVTASDTFASLFSAASLGGAYNYGEGGAYGRRYAWRSLGGLVGAADTDPPESVAELAGRCQHLAYASATGWFDEIAWDLGIAVLRPDHRTLAVLAATDTD